MSQFAEIGHGVASLNELIGLGLSRSCADHGIPKPELNVTVDDRRKVAVLQLPGYVVLPLTALDDDAARLVSAAVAAR